MCLSKVTALTLWMQHALFIHVCTSTAIQLIFELLASWSFHLSIPSWQWKYDLPSHNSLELLLLNIYRMFTKVVCRQKKWNWHVALIHSTPTCVAAGPSAFWFNNLQAWKGFMYTTIDIWLSCYTIRYLDLLAFCVFTARDTRSNIAQCLMSKCLTQPI